MKHFILTITIWGLCLSGLWAQSEIRGKVFELDESGKEQDLEGATVFLLKLQKGTFTNAQGQFKLPWSEGDTLVIRHISYEDDTLLVVPGQEYYRTVLSAPATQATVEIRSRVGASEFSMLDPMGVQTLGRKELCKAACCNLGESFQANGAVDVSNSDAATGSREIRLLGLAGRYSQLLTEKRTMTRGLGAVYGLNYIPGDWIESIQISKGAGAVVDGYESMTGEINVELRKPQDMDPLHLNLYQNNNGRTEANLGLAHRFSPKLSSAILAHGSLNGGHRDPDGDHFLNNPLGSSWILQNRWLMTFTENFQMQVGGQYLEDKRTGGQVHFDPSRDRGSSTVWGLGVDNRQASAFMKAGFTAKNHPERSLGIILSGVRHDLDSYFGLREYNGLQYNGRANIIWQDQLASDKHGYRTGVSFMADDYQERLDDSTFARRELVPGVFGEYTWKPSPKWAVVGGLRVDRHNLFGTMVTPRFHMRFSPAEKTSLRLAAGKGYRTPNPVAENIAVLASSRTFVVSELPRQEQAWTFGAGMVQRFKIGDREGSAAMDFYRTEFVSRLVPDIEDPRILQFYNIDGGSFSNVAQVEADAEVLPRLDLRMALRYQDVRCTYEGVLKEMPLTPKWNGVFNVAYENRPGRWLADMTLGYTGSQRLPSTAENPDGYRLGDRSPGFLRLHAQVTRRFGKLLEVYLGGENLTNFRQPTPIVSAHDPFGPYFDASIAWGPLMGAMGYVGLRFDIK